MARVKGKFYQFCGEYEGEFVTWNIPFHNSKYCIGDSPLAISDYMSGKMFNIPSISTSCVVNPICIARMKDPDSICAKCFAEGVINRYSDLGQNCEDNFHLLNSKVLDLDLLPLFKPDVKVVRIESFGDVGSVVHAINYINLIKKNPHVMFAWWSKNAPIINKAFEQVGKPKNVVMVESSEKVNVQKEMSPNFDKVFTVYDAKHIAENNVNINCGARSCDTCRRCYSKRTGAIVNEQLKGVKAA